jgi:hypothetical protein
VTPNFEHFYIVFPVGLLLLYLLITDRRKNTHLKCTQLWPQVHFTLQL